MLLSIFTLANKLDAGWYEVYCLAQDGAVPPPVYVGGFARFRAADVEAWMNAGFPVGTALSDDACAELGRALLVELKDRKEIEQ